jgi:hypothetical protein
MRDWSTMRRQDVDAAEPLTLFDLDEIRAGYDATPGTLFSLGQSEKPEPELPTRLVQTIGGRWTHPGLSRCPRCQRLACAFCFEIHCDCRPRPQDA